MVTANKLIGTVLYFVCIGLWFIVLTSCLFWAIILVLPPMFIWWLIGVASAGFIKRTVPWPAFKAFWLWESIRKHYFEYTVHGPGKDLIEREMSSDVSATGSANKYKKLMWTVYPHGILPWTAIFFWGLNPKFKSVIPCIHSSIFMIPLIRDMAGWMGCTTVDKQDMITALNNSGRIVMAPGGIADIAAKGNDVVKRMGFLKLAKETGACVVPIWIPEERSYYSMWLPLGRTLESFLCYPFPMFTWGLFWLPFIPKKIKTRILVGDPIQLKDISVKQAYTLYYKAIVDLQKIKC